MNHHEEAIMVHKSQHHHLHNKGAQKLKIIDRSKISRLNPINRKALRLKRLDSNHVKILNNLSSRSKGRKAKKLGSQENKLRVSLDRSKVKQEAKVAMSDAHGANELNLQPKGDLK
jgi:hypothetical protein